MIILQTILSISSIVLYNCLVNGVCKKDLKTTDHVHAFTSIFYAVCVVLFACLAFSGGISWYTVILGLVFGAVTNLSAYYKMRSLAEGPMHITLLVTTSSMIVPTMSGVFFGESFSIWKLVIVFILIFFIYLSFDKSGDKRINKKWVIFCIIAFIFQAAVGVLQKVHQSSEYKGEIGVFLLIAFICSLVFSLVRRKTPYRALGFTKKQVIFALVCGICTFTMNYINLKLSGLLPSQLFFPLINGSAIILSSLSSVFIFKESLSKKQVVGLVGGILSLIAICLVK